MPRSSSSTTPTLRLRSPPPSSASSGTRGRPASRRTGCSCRTGIYEAFLERFTGEVESLRVADGFTDGVQVGPLIDEPALDKVESHVADALDRGAELVTGGDRLDGQFYRPSILTGVDPGDADEPGGDVRPGGRDRALRDRGRGVALANATPYGLAAYYMTTDLARTWRVGEALEYGIVGVNTGLDLDRGRALRRRQGVRHRPRGVELRGRRLDRAQVLGGRRARADRRLRRRR